MSFVLTAALFCVACPQSDGIDAPEPPQFAEPIRLMSEGAPLGVKLLYPSPRLYDIDRDGQAEMVTGDLFGRVMVAEKSAGAGAAEWGPLEAYMTGKRALKFHNW